MDQCQYVKGERTTLRLVYGDQAFSDAVKNGHRVATCHFQQELMVSKTVV